MSDNTIASLSCAEQLCALYNNSRPLGMGILHFTPEPLSLSEAQDVLSAGQPFRKPGYVDYLKGRVIKCLFEEGEIPDFWLYDRDNGAGAGERALQRYAKSKAA